MTKMSPFQIKNFRKQTGLSQKAFAQAVDLPIRTYRSYESGKEASPLTSSENSKKNSVIIKSVTEII
ncbi:MAG: helix-turn-helix domain-containing protein [Streptococcus sp.]